MKGETWNFDLRLSTLIKISRKSEHSLNIKHTAILKNVVYNTNLIVKTNSTNNFGPIELDFPVFTLLVVCLQCHNGVCLLCFFLSVLPPPLFCERALRIAHSFVEKCISFKEYGTSRTFSYTVVLCE